MGYKRILDGVVVKAGTMKKTIVVMVREVKMHDLYHKRIRTKKNYKVHDEKNEAKVGDMVSIIETRHISKDKYFKLLKVVTPAAPKEEIQ